MEVKVGEDRLGQGVALQPGHQASQGRVHDCDLDLNNREKIASLEQLKSFFEVSAAEDDWIEHPESLQY